MSQKIKIVFLTILTLIIINCGTVFASGASEGFEYFLENDSRFTSFKQTDYYTTAMNVLYNYENIVIYVYKQDTTDFLNVYVTNNKFYEQNGNYYVDGPYRRLEIWLTSDTKVWRYQNIGSNSDGGFGKPEILYTNSGILKSDGSFAVPPTNTYKGPSFEYSQSLISDMIGIETQSGIKYIDGFNYKTILNNYSLGSLYIEDLNDEISHISLYKYNLDGTSVSNNKVYLYDENSEWSDTGYRIGYLEYKGFENEISEYSFYYPDSFIKPGYIYYLSIIKTDISSLSIDPFVVMELSENEDIPSSPGTIISGDNILTSGDISDIIEDNEKITTDDISGIVGEEIGKLNQNIENTILGTENESGDRQGGLLGGLLDGIIGLFIPSSEDMTIWLSDTQDEVTEKLGILGEPINFFNGLMKKLIVGTSGDFIIEIPALSIPSTTKKGASFQLYSGDTINFNEQMEKYPIFKEIYNKYIVIISGIMVYCFYSYLWSLYDHFLGSRSVESSYRIIDDEVEKQQIIQKEKNRRPIGFQVKGDNRK